MNCQAKLEGVCTGQAWEIHHWPKRATAFYKKRKHLLDSPAHKKAVCRSCHHVLDVGDRSKNAEIFPRSTMKIAEDWKKGIAPE